jgi:hypothetical protein
MQLHPDELALARAYDRSLPFESLTEAQVSTITRRGRELFQWYKTHRRLHLAISAITLTSIFGLDYLANVVVPAWLLGDATAASTARVVLVAILSGGLHSWLMYSLSVYSMHEGAAHRLIFPPAGPITRVLHVVSANLCRIAASEPKQYSTRHMIHHAKFGTEQDAEFLNFVAPRRYWPTFFPLAFDINYTDFIVHRPLEWNRDRLLSAPFAIPYHGLYAWYAWTHFGLLFTIVAFAIVLPHVGFFLDRVRQFTEHNLMPLDNKNGSRSFGVGFWGLLVGGGPWGSPCHWEHHLVPSLPWYQQLILHRDVVRMLTPAQRRQFLIAPVIGFPMLWWQLVRDANRFARSHSLREQSRAS